VGVNNFIVEMFDSLDWRNSLLQSYLSIECRDRNIETAKLLSENRVEALESIRDGFLSGSRVVVVQVPDMIEAEIIGSWTEVIYAIMFEVKAVRVMYNTFVGIVRKGEAEAVDLYTKAPFIIFMFPELALNSAWVQGTLVQSLSGKKHIMIITSNPKQMSSVFGDLVSKSLKKMGTRVIVMGDPA